MTMQPTRTTWSFGSMVTAVAADWAQTTGAFGLANGQIRLVPFATQEQKIERSIDAHKGAVTVLAAHPDGGFVSSGDDGRVLRILPDDSMVELARHPNQWIETLVVLDDGGIAYGLGKTVHLIGADGTPRHQFGPHPSTIAALRLQPPYLAAAHYGGVTLWSVQDPAAEPTRLAWKGSHLAIAIAPDGSHVATSTQEMDIHGWRLIDGREMRMAGYPSKVKSLDFSADGQWLATSGADLLVAWPFDGPGPEGRPPLELIDGKGSLVTRVACHPSTPMVACGFEDGNLALVDLATRQGGKFQVTKRGPITAITWSRDGDHMLCGAEDGRAAIFSAPVSKGV